MYYHIYKLSFVLFVEIIFKFNETIRVGQAGQHFESAEGGSWGDGGQGAETYEGEEADIATMNDMYKSEWPSWCQKKSLNSLKAFWVRAFLVQIILSTRGK